MVNNITEQGRIMNVKRSIKGTETNWVAMQTETFINWININLSSRGMAIKDIETAFDDGIKLIHLFEVISKRSIGKYAKNPKFHTQKMENVSLVLREMELDGVKAISIDSDHVVKGNFKMILGLIWQLILRYQVGGSEDETIKVVLKKLLLNWLQRVVPEQNIRNLTIDWNSGIALCNLINVLKPGLCPEYTSMTKSTSIENVNKGLQLAEDAFGIPRIISAEYMACPKVDDLSMITYFSYFTQDNGIGEEWMLNLIKEWNPQIEVVNFNSDWNTGHTLCKLVNTFVPNSVDETLLSNNNVENCRLTMNAALQYYGVQKIIKPEDMANPRIPELAIMAYVVQFSKTDEIGDFCVSGDGLAEAKINVVNEFHVTFPKYIAMECFYVIVLNPRNEILDIEVENNDAHFFRTFKYIPEEPGNYTISISYEGKQISQSPYLVHVMPNLEPLTTRNDAHLAQTQMYAEVKEKIGISVDTSNSGKGRLTATTKGPKGLMLQSKVLHEVDGTNTVSFIPAFVGEYLTTVYWNGKPIAQSPFTVLVSDPCKCVAKQPVISEGEIKKKMSFDILTTGAGPGFITSYVEYLGGNIAVDVVVVQVQEDHYSCCFTPYEPGQYLLHVNYSECPINGSPFNITITDQWKVDVLIDSLIEGETLTPYHFNVTVDDDNGIGDLKCIVSDPQGEDVLSDLVETEDGNFGMMFTPSIEGEHSVNVYYMGKLVKNCPYMVNVITSGCDVYLNTEPIAIEEPIDPGTQLFAEIDEKIGISVDTRKSGEGRLTANTIGPENLSFSTNVLHENDNTNTVSFTPSVIGLYETNVYWNGTPIKGSPFNVWVCDPRKCIVREPIISESQINRELVFEVLTAGAGPGSIISHLEYMDSIFDVRLTKLDDECVSCAFVPHNVGEYMLYINYNDSSIIGSPFNITVCDPSNINILIDTNTVTETHHVHIFNIRIEDGVGASTLKCLINGPDGEDVKSDIVKGVDGRTTRASFIPTNDGCYKVNVFYAGILAQQCPYLVYAITSTPIIPPDATQVITSGDGLYGGFVNEICRLSIDAKDAGIGQLSVAVQGVKHDVVVGIREEGDGVYEATYTPQVNGEYILNIRWDKNHVSGSPFKVVIRERASASAVVLTGKGLEEGTVGQPIIFTADGRNAGPGHLSCRCRAPSGEMTHVLISNNNDGTHAVDVNASVAGLHKVHVEWDSEAVPGSPFFVKIMQAPDASKVRVYGPGLTAGIVDTFQGIFHVDTKCGGPGALKVRIQGPKECFKVEMYRDHPKDRVINVSYNPRVPGIYTANVFWSDEHVDGSPFEIFVAAKKNHLEKWNRSREEMDKREVLAT